MFSRPDPRLKASLLTSRRGVAFDPSAAVSNAAAPAARDYNVLTNAIQIADLRAGVRVIQHGADGDENHAVISVLAALGIAAAMTAAAGMKFVEELEIEEGGNIRVRAYDDVAAITAVAAVRIGITRVRRLRK